MVHTFKIWWLGGALVTFKPNYASSATMLQVPLNGLQTKAMDSVGNAFSVSFSSYSNVFVGSDVPVAY